MAEKLLNEPLPEEILDVVCPYACLQDHEEQFYSFNEPTLHGGEHSDTRFVSLRSQLQPFPSPSSSFNSSASGFAVTPSVTTPSSIVPSSSFSSPPSQVPSIPLRLPSPSTSHSGYHDNQGVPSLEENTRTPAEKFPGKYNFSIEIVSTEPKQKSWLFSEEHNTLMIKVETNFAVVFRMDGVSPHLSVRAMVRYSDPVLVEQHGPVHPCCCRIHMESRKRVEGADEKNPFIIVATPTASSARYSERSTGDVTVTVELKNLPMMNGSHFCVFRYRSYTSCLAKKSQIVTIFSLMDGKNEVGRDAYICRVCASPSRDYGKLRQRELAGNSRPRKRRKNQSELEDQQLPPLSFAPLPPRPSSPSASSQIASPPFHSHSSLTPSLPFYPPFSSPPTCSPSLLSSNNLSLVVPPGLIYHDPDMTMARDKEGYFTFSWKLRDQGLFHYLCHLKRHVTLLNNTHQASTEE